jgi:hypothetical protein
MKLGLLSDVHGNRIALEAVLADGRSHGVEAWWALGDLVAIGPDPVPTLEPSRSYSGCLPRWKGRSHGPGAR